MVPHFLRGFASEGAGDTLVVALALPHYVMEEKLRLRGLNSEWVSRTRKISLPAPIPIKLVVPASLFR
jgi:hypothetical protein